MEDRELLYREELESGPLFTDVERGMGMTQEDWDQFIRENWEERMLTQAQLLSIEDPPFAQSAKQRRREATLNFERNKRLVTVAKIERVGLGMDVGAAILHFVVWVGICYLVYQFMWGD